MLQAGNHYESTVELSSAEGAGRSRVQHFFLERYAAAYRAEADHFADMLDGVPPRTTGDDGRRSMILAEAALQSVATGRTVQID